MGIEGGLWMKLFTTALELETTLDEEHVEDVVGYVP